MGMVEIEDIEHITLPILQMTGAVLPGDYPLFDWADWPDSRAALVPGGPTRNFETACWNAIVRALSRAAIAAGFAEENVENHFIASLALGMTGGRLMAKQMNSLVEAFDKFLPMGWFWRSERFGTFEKKEFYGRPGWGGFYPDADILYPEYILGLADRVNLYIQLMRGNYPYTIGSAASYPAISRILTGGTKVGGQARADAVQQSGVTISEIAAETGISRPFSAQIIARTTLEEFPVEAHPALKGYVPEHIARLNVRMSGRSFLGSLPQVVSVKSGALVCLEEILLTRGRRESEATHRAFTAPEADVSGMAASTVGVQQKNRSSTGGEAASVLSLPVGTSHIAGAAAKAEFVTEPGLGTIATDISGTACSLTIVKPPILLTWADGKSKTGVTVSAEESMVDPVQAGKSAWTSVACSLDTAWLPPVWVDGGLFIRQVRQATVLEDGSLDLTGGGDELLVQHSSKTAVTCALDTAWYPPVMVDGGLWIRQVQNAVQRENNELEVQ